MSTAEAVQQHPDKASPPCEIQPTANGDTGAASATSPVSRHPTAFQPTSSIKSPNSPIIRCDLDEPVDYELTSPKSSPRMLESSTARLVREAEEAPVKEQEEREKQEKGKREMRQKKSGNEEEEKQNMKPKVYLTGQLNGIKMPKWVPRSSRKMMEEELSPSDESSSDLSPPQSISKRRRLR
ncbi:hypothetical protein EKO04_011589 [Ascochyta lentis]|uniref:Uncharacterized protein n=1 Tax=Ascochyta lentis TaxID=205686 RepID=A0A8H7ISG6_9PLEO|nr:hypothetical protein EKO04_011589 [Ascochyta lentis]